MATWTRYGDTPTARHEVRSVEEAGAGEEPGPERSPARPAVVQGVAAAQAEVHRPQPEGDGTHPGEGGQPGRGDDDEQRDQGAQQAERPAPLPGDGEDGEHEADVLGEADEPLRRERDAEHLEHPGEHPEGPGPVQVEEVLVGDEALHHHLREDEHEALFHRRSLVAELAVQRHGERQQQHAERDARPLPAAEPVEPPRCRGRRCVPGLRPRVEDGDGRWHGRSG
jgi:hypothetical protein